MCLGVSHSITNIEKLIIKLSSFVKKNGLIVIGGLFNDYDIDTKKDYSDKKNKWQIILIIFLNTLYQKY